MGLRKLNTAALLLRGSIWAGLLSLISSLALAQLQPAPSEAPELSSAERTAQERLLQLGSRSVRLHDPSTVVRSNGEYWLFATGRGVLSFRSKDLLNWESGPPVFTNAPPWVAEAVPENQRMHFWAPDVIELNGRYLLYYSVSSFGKNRSVIALAENTTLDPAASNYQWIDRGIVMRSDATNDFNAIDPAITIDQSGRLWMSFGSFWSGIKLVELDPKSGKRLAPESPMYSLARKDAIEAPYIYFHDEHYYLLLNWGFCCRGTNSTYNMRMGRSREITGPYLDKDGKDMAEGGGTLLAETDGEFIGPGHPGIIKEGNNYWMSMHFYNGTQRGTPTLAVRRMRWSKEGWPELLP